MVLLHLLPPLLPLLLLLLLSGSPPAYAQLPIKIGMTGPLTDDAGQRVSAGMKFAFEEANQAGGVMGRNITLVALEDGYNTTTAMANIYRLLDTEKVLLLAGVVGSDIVQQATPLILQRRVPYVGPFSGAASLHTPFHQEFINIRASFNDEVVAQATFLVQNSQVQRIACLYQDDSFGVGGHAALVAALANVGLELVASGSYALGTTNVEGALEAIATAPRKPQAVVLLALQAPIIKFINLYTADTRSDPTCIFTVMSPGWGTSFSKEFNRTLWDRVYFFFVVPLTRDPSWAISRHFTAVYTGTSGTIAFEGYIVGRFIVEVLKRIRSTNVTSAMFLDEVYSTRMFVLDDLVVGMYSSNYSGCSQALCSCNSGLRSVYTAQLDTSVSGYLRPGLATIRYSVLECSSPISNVIAPLLFGQLLPGWDDGWRAVALDIGRGIRAAFAEANAGGGAGGREFILLQQNYSSSATEAMDKLSDRYPLIALLSCVVPNTAQINVPIASIGNFDIEADAEDDPFSRAEIHLQPATSLELMALAQWTTQHCTAIHLRAASSDSGQELLDVLIQSVQSFQRRAASASTFSFASDVLSSTQEGCLIAVGSDADLLSWYNTLPLYPNLHLLTLSSSAMRLMAVSPNASGARQASQFHFSTMITDKWNDTIPNSDPSEPWKYGYILGQGVVQSLTHSQFASSSFTSPTQLLSAWYTVKVMTSGALTLGPYHGNNCSQGQTECECSEGVRSVAVRSLASPVTQNQYSISTCHVVYSEFLEPSNNDWVITVVVAPLVSIFGCVGVGVVLYLHRTKRNHSAAPKDIHKPFCVLFTDIQASTHLWATIPDVMAPALSTHHELVRKMIVKHQCYEVKTIGDSFMCAAHTSQQALQLALAIQTTLHDHNWGTDAIDSTYQESLNVEDVGQVSCSCWNGLRIRIGIHHGLGDIQFDPVSQGYDYYGTVVNTAARIENVCHGGQIGVSREVYNEVKDSVSNMVWSDLGCHSLRGLTEPIHLYQVLPAGTLAARTFPPLRLDKQGWQEMEAEVELEIVSATVPDRRSITDGGIKRNSVFPASSVVSTVDNWRWVETHPLVLNGSVKAEELKRCYTIAHATLSTLLNTQTEKFRQQVVHGLCERLHVTDYGPQGAMLQRTLRGLVHRVLPATVVNAQQQLKNYCLIGQSSRGSMPPSPTLSQKAGSFRQSRPT